MVLVKQNKYRNENRELVREQGRGYYINNREKECADTRKYYAKNKDLVLIKAIKYRKENSVKIKIALSKYRKNNRELINERAKKDYHANRDSKILVAKKYRDNNREKINEKSRNNKPYNNMRMAQRRAVKLNATPTWADFDRIKEIYKVAHLLTNFFGVSMHVDHILPLQGKVICGFHVENNLRIVDIYTNCSKRNIYEVSVN